MTGKIKFYNEQKGYGFITCEEGEIFLHASQLGGRVPTKGDEVEFTIGPGKKGDEAKDVIIINGLR